GGQPDLTILDAGADLQRDDPAYEKFGLEFYVGIPVRVDGHVYGTLCFGDIENPEDGFDPAKRAFLTILALLIGHEIEGIEQRRYISVYERVLRHNLRNSLTVIYGHLNTLQNRLENDEPIAVIRNEVQELLTLAEEAQTLQDLLHSDVRTEPINMADMAERSVRRIRLSYPRAKIGLETPEQAVTSGISQIRVALEELLENAIIHSEKVEPSVKVEVSTTDRHVRLQVIDDGPGIPEDERRVLSNDGDISTTQHGSGLGLWLVRLIVQQSNGRLSFSRAKHGGSKIEMTFARTDNRPTETW
ncbi:MAG: ATP-binding protein, partial [Halodesulfurarchaeum sp.]